MRVATTAVATADRTDEACQDVPVPSLVTVVGDDDGPPVGDRAIPIFGSVGEVCPNIPGGLVPDSRPHFLGEDVFRVGDRDDVGVGVVGESNLGGGVGGHGDSLMGWAGVFRRQG